MSRRKSKDKIIYHYCTLDTFFRIITNKTIRLSDLRKTNDSAEKLWGEKVALEALNESLKDNGINMELHEDYYYSDGVLSHYEQAKSELNRMLKNKTLITCFSLEGDQLGQWRGYGQNGEGISIGFDYKLLKKNIKGNDNVIIDEVIYKKEKQIKVVKEKLFLPAIQYMRNMFDEDKVRCSESFNEYFIEEFDCFCEVLDYSAEYICDIIKNPAFKEEKEVRIMYNTGLFEEEEKDEVLEICNKEILLGSKNALRLEPIRYQVKGCNLVSYADLMFENLVSEGIIKEIIIGPKSKATIDDIVKFLYIKGFDENVSVRVSSSTYQ